MNARVVAASLHGVDGGVAVGADLVLLVAKARQPLELPPAPAVPAAVLEQARGVARSRSSRPSRQRR